MKKLPLLGIMTLAMVCDPLQLVHTQSAVANVQRLTKKREITVNVRKHRNVRKARVIQQKRSGYRYLGRVSGARLRLEVNPLLKGEVLITRGVFAGKRLGNQEAPAKAPRVRDTGQR